MLHMISPVQLVATTLNLFHRTVPDQVGWILAVGELYNGLNPISLDDSRITLLERPLVNRQQDSSQTLQSPESQLCPIGVVQT